MNLLNQLKTRQNELLKIISSLEQFIATVPEGKLIARKVYGNYYYSKKVYSDVENNSSNTCVTNEKNKGAKKDSGKKQCMHRPFNEIYLPKKSEETLLLAKGEYAVRCLKDARNELVIVNRYIDVLEKGTSAEKFLQAHPGFNELVAPSLKNTNDALEKWRTEDYYQNPYHPEMLKYPTVIPEIKVRSKSEADILSRLVHFHVPFHYEEGFNTGKGWKFPDFSVRAIVPPYEKFYWEHMGGMDSFKYFNENMKKLNELFLCGLVPWKNLIITTETADEPLDINWVDEIIKYYLL